MTKKLLERYAPHQSQAKYRIDGGHWIKVDNLKLIPRFEDNCELSKNGSCETVEMDVDGWLYRYTVAHAEYNCNGKIKVLEMRGLDLCSGPYLRAVMRELDKEIKTRQKRLMIPPARFKGFNSAELNERITKLRKADREHQRKELDLVKEKKKGIVELMRREEAGQ